MTKPTNTPPIPTEKHWTYSVSPVMEKLGNKITQSQPMQQWINDMQNVEDFEEMDEWIETNLLQHLELSQWEIDHPSKTPTNLKKDEEDDTPCL